MPGEIKVYALGGKGINVSDDVRHMDVADLEQAQNASFYGSGQWGGLAKRLGMRAINTVALAGVVLSIANATFSDPTPDVVLTDTAGYTLTDDSYMVLVE